jgi:hypothetical protein
MSVELGDKAFAEAEKKLKGSMFGFGKDPDAAVDCFKRACNNYKVAGSCALDLQKAFAHIHVLSRFTGKTEGASTSVYCEENNAQLDWEGHFPTL